MGTTERENEELARRLYDAFGNGEKETVFELLADDFVNHSGVQWDHSGVARSNEELWEAFRDTFYDPCSDITAEVEHVVAEDDMVAVRWRYTGIHEDGELMGIPPTGADIDFTGNTLLRIEDGEVTDRWVEWDSRAVLQALDIFPDSMYDMKITRQLLQVLLRVLRHNLRNDLSTIKGFAELIAAEDVPAPEYAERILAAADSLQATAKKVRDIERSVVNVDERELVRVSEVVGTVVAEQRRRYPAIEPTVSVPDETVAITSNRLVLSVVLEEAIENAAVHADTPAPEVGIEVSPADVEKYAVTVSIADSGPGIPDHELEPLFRETEDPLEHGSGIGLWAIKWGVEQLDGEVEFAENEPRGSVVRLHLPDMD